MSYYSSIKKAIETLKMKIKAGIDVTPIMVKENNKNYMITYSFVDNYYFITIRLLNLRNNN